MDARLQSESGWGALESWGSQGAAHPGATPGLGEGGGSSRSPRTGGGQQHDQGLGLWCTDQERHFGWLEVGGDTWSCKGRREERVSKVNGHNDDDAGNSARRWSDKDDRCSLIDAYGF